MDKMKKTCNGCRAYESHHECSLGFKNDKGKPKEICPKPTTISKLQELETANTTYTTTQTKNK